MKRQIQTGTKLCAANEESTLEYTVQIQHGYMDWEARIFYHICLRVYEVGDLSHFLQRNEGRYG